MATVTGLTAERMLDIEAMVETMEGNTPGTELIYARLQTGFTTTAVGAALAVITGLSGVMIGTGRAVDIELYLSKVYHSVADGGCQAAIFGVKTGTAGAYRQVAQVQTPQLGPSYGTSMILKDRLVIPAGEEWTFAAYLSGLVAGTSTLNNSTVNPSHLSVVSR